MTWKDVIGALLALLAAVAFIVGITVWLEISKEHTTERFNTCVTGGGQWIDGDGVSLCINPNGTVTTDS